MEERPGGRPKGGWQTAQSTNTTVTIPQTRIRTPSLEEMPERTPGNAPVRGPGHAPLTSPQKGKTGGRPRVEAGAPPCLRRPLTNLGRSEGFVRTNQITARPLEMSASRPKRTYRTAGGPRGRRKSATANPETRTPHGATRVEVRIPRTPLTAGGVAGKRTSSKSGFIVTC